MHDVKQKNQNQKQQLAFNIIQHKQQQQQKNSPSKVFST